MVESSVIYGKFNIRCYMDKKDRSFFKLPIELTLVNKMLKASLQKYFGEWNL